MRSSIIAFAACTLSFASALQYPDSVSLEKRQQPGTPQYDCHSNCGNVIALGRNTGHCTQTSFTDALTSCLNCALQYDIWQYYGTSVSQLAQGCGLNSTPTPANSSATTTTLTSAGDSVTVTSTSVSFSSDTAATQATATNESASTSEGGSSSTSESGAAATTAAATEGSETSSASASAGAAATTNAGGEGIGNRLALDSGLVIFSMAALYMLLA